MTAVIVTEDTKTDIADEEVMQEEEETQDVIAEERKAERTAKNTLQNSWKI